MNEDRIPESAAPILPQPFPEGERPRAPQVRQEHRSFFWPVVLIGFGVLLLLSNLGMFPESGWAVLWRFWPVALVALGLDVLIGRRTLGGAIASGVLILILAGMVIGLAFFAEQVPALVELTQSSKLLSKHVEHPIEKVESAKVTIDWNSAPGYLSALGDSRNLIEADVDYHGELAFRVTDTNGRAEVVLDSYFQGVTFRFSQWNFGNANAKWDVKLNPAVAYDLWMDTGSGSCDLDLSRFTVNYLNLDSGSGSVHLKLPAASKFDGELNTGSGSVTIDVPNGVGVRVTLDSGSGSFQPDARFTLVSGKRDGDGVWETKNYASADYKIDLTIDQGSGSIQIR